MSKQIKSGGELYYLSVQAVDHNPVRVSCNVQLLKTQTRGSTSGSLTGCEKENKLVALIRMIIVNNILT